MLENIMVVERKNFFTEKIFNGIVFEDIENYLDIISKHYAFLPRVEMETDPTYKQIIPYLVFNFEDKYFLMQRKSDCTEKRLANKMSLGIGGHVNEISCDDFVNNMILGSLLQCQCCKNKNSFQYVSQEIDKKLFIKSCEIDKNFQLKSCSCFSCDEFGCKPCSCDYSFEKVEKEFKPKSLEWDFFDSNSCQISCVGDGLNLIFSGAQREFNEEIDYKGNISAKIIGLINDESNFVGQVHLGILILLKGDSPNIKVKSELKSGNLVSLEECKSQFDNLEPWTKFVVNWLIENPETFINKSNKIDQLNILESK